MRLYCERCRMVYEVEAYARITGTRLRPGDADPDTSWSCGAAPCGGQLVVEEEPRLTMVRDGAFLDGTPLTCSEDDPAQMRMPYGAGFWWTFGVGMWPDGTYFAGASLIRDGESIGDVWKPDVHCQDRHPTLEAAWLCARAESEHLDDLPLPPRHRH